MSKADRLGLPSKAEQPLLALHSAQAGQPFYWMWALQTAGATKGHSTGTQERTIRATQPRSEPMMYIRWQHAKTIPVSLPGLTIYLPSLVTDRNLPERRPLPNPSDSAHKYQKAHNYRTQKLKCTLQAPCVDNPKQTSVWKSWRSKGK